MTIDEFVTKYRGKKITFDPPTVDDPHILIPDGVYRKHVFDDGTVAKESYDVFATFEYNGKPFKHYAIVMDGMLKDAREVK